MRQGVAETKDADCHVASLLAMTEGPSISNLKTRISLPLSLRRPAGAVAIRSLFPTRRGERCPFFLCLSKEKVDKKRNDSRGGPRHPPGANGMGRSDHRSPPSGVRGNSLRSASAGAAKAPHPLLPSSFFHTNPLALGFVWNLRACQFWSPGHGALPCCSRELREFTTRRLDLQVVSFPCRSSAVYPAPGRGFSKRGNRRSGAPSCAVSMGVVLRRERFPRRGKCQRS